jgi:hypothetical protein
MSQICDIVKWSQSLKQKNYIYNTDFCWRKKKNNSNCIHGNYHIFRENASNLPGGRFCPMLFCICLECGWKELCDEKPNILCWCSCCFCPFSFSIRSAKPLEDSSSGSKPVHDMKYITIRLYKISNTVQDISNIKYSTVQDYIKYINIQLHKLSNI